MLVNRQRLALFQFRKLQPKGLWITYSRVSRMLDFCH